MSVDTTPVLVPKYVFKRMAMLPINLPQLLAELSIEPTVLLSDETSLPLYKYSALWQRVAELCEDPAIALQVASYVKPEHFGVVSYSMITSPTLAKGFALLAKYNKVRGICDFSEHKDDKHVIIGFDWPVQNLPKHHCESALVYLVSLFRWVTDSDIHPVMVSFRFPRPVYAPLLEQFFGCSVGFGQSRESLVVATEDFNRPIVWHNSELNKTFVGSATQRISSKRKDERFSDKVRAVIIEMLALNNPVAADVAQNLNVSLRTLHRKLKNEQTSFQQQLDEVRKSQSLALIAVEGVEFKEVAYRLGYANLSAFYRAFNRWTGTTPMAYRHRRLETD